MNRNLNIPWIEKYRPTKLNQIVNNDIIINCLEKMIENKIIKPE